MSIDARAENETSKLVTIAAAQRFLEAATSAASACAKRIEASAASPNHLARQHAVTHLGGVETTYDQLKWASSLGRGGILLLRVGDIGNRSERINRESAKMRSLSAASAGEQTNNGKRPGERAWRGGDGASSPYQRRVAMSCR